MKDQRGYGGGESRDPVPGARGSGTRGGGTGRGNYPPANIKLGKEDLIKGLKGIKLKFPNRKYTTGAYKAGLKKSVGGHSEGESE